LYRSDRRHGLHDPDGGEIHPGNPLHDLHDPDGGKPYPDNRLSGGSAVFDAYKPRRRHRTRRAELRAVWRPGRLLASPGVPGGLPYRIRTAVPHLYRTLAPATPLCLQCKGSGVISVKGREIKRLAALPA